MIRCLAIVCLFVTVYSNPVSRNGPFTVHQIPEYIIFNGYEAERHPVITPDGYILEMHRIPFGRHQTTSDVTRPAVFLMHGLQALSNSYIALGPEYSIAYNLADAGFDVWLGNARGTRLGRQHVTLDPDHETEKFQFFDFSWEEIGMIDVASMIDYVLEFTGQEKLHYVGHSQGGTSFLVLTSMRPEYNDKLKTVHILAGVGYMEHFPDPMLRTVAAMTDIIFSIAQSVGYVELFPPGTNADEGLASNITSRADLCTGHIESKYLCDLMGIRHIFKETEDEDDTSDNATETLERDNGGSSMKQIAHYGQNIRDRTFRRWNYGTAQNTEIYGSSTPPDYDLGLITADVIMHYTVNDYLLDERDVLAMAADMPNTVVRKVARESFLHEDFAVSEDVKELVTDFMIEYMLNHEEANAVEEIVDPEIDDDQPDSASSTTLNVLLKLAYIITFSMYFMAK